MKLIYSGKTKEFTPELEDKIGVKLAKLSKFIEQRGEREAHISHSLERHQHRVEIVVNFYDHSLAGEGVDADLDTALCHAVEKVEKQVVKLRTRWRDTHRDQKGVRTTKEEWDSKEAGAPANEPANGTARKPKVFRVNYEDGRKPMTLEEALIDMEGGVDYVVYRDSGRNCMSVLIRRTDGNFDLIES